MAPFPSIKAYLKSDQMASVSLSITTSLPSSQLSYPTPFLAAYFLHTLNGRLINSSLKCPTIFISDEAREGGRRI